MSHMPCADSQGAAQLWARGTDLMALVQRRYLELLAVA